jgi:hypothetical protein
LAVMTTVSVDVTADVVAVNVVDEDPAGIVADAGIVAAVELAERPITAPPDGAAPDSVTVQVLGAPPVTAPGAHWMDESVTAGDVTVNDAVWVAPL